MIQDERLVMMLLRGAVLSALLALLIAPVSEAARPSVLIDAARSGDISALREAVGASDLNASDVDGTTALHWAVYNDDVEAVDMLLQAGADPRASNRYGVRPLPLAATNGSAAIIERLLAAGADVNGRTLAGETPLMLAARAASREVVELLLAHGAEVNAVEPSHQQTALMWAAMTDNAGAIRALIAAGADVSARSQSPMPSRGRRAMGQGDDYLPEMFKRTNGGPLNRTTMIDSMSALLFAVRDGHIGASTALLDGGADVNDRAPNGATALHVAIINAHYELASLLVDRGADVNDNGPGWTPLHQVARTPRTNFGRFPAAVPTGRVSPVDLARKLIASGADVNARMTKITMADGYRSRINKMGATPFLLAAKGVFPDLLRVLAENGADATIRNEDGSTPLMLASGVGLFNEGEDPGTEPETLETVKFLVEECGADVNETDISGETPLHGAAYRGYNSVVQYLVDHGAQLDARNKLGWTPLRIADGVYFTDFFKQARDTAKLLRKLMAERNIPFDEAGIVNEDPNSRRSIEETRYQIVRPKEPEAAAPEAGGPSPKEAGGAGSGAEGAREK